MWAFFGCAEILSDGTEMKTLAFLKKALCFRG